MARYSVEAITNDLSDLIDKALSGEEVVLTRQGKPQVALTVVRAEEKPPKKGLAWLKEQREKHPPRRPLEGNSVLEMRKEYRY